MKHTLLWLWLLFPMALAAQPTVAPTPDPPVSSGRGENVSGYNIQNSFEAGYRFAEVDGDVGKYRSDVNYGNGVRLLSSSLAVHSLAGNGRFFDELLLDTQGLGNDPYEYASLRVQKNRLYQYSLVWREETYYNPALTISYGYHAIDTTRFLQDQSLIILPDRKISFLAGYSRNSQSGPALTTVNINGTSGAEYPLFSNIRRTDDEYRAGVDVNVGGVKLSVTRAWEFFKDDTQDTQSQASAIPPRTGTLTDFIRDQPYRDSVNHWRVYLMADRSKRYGLNGRFTYSGGHQDFLFNQAYVAGSAGSPVANQTLITGNGLRQVIAANLTANVFLTPKLTLVNHTSFDQTRMDGNSAYSELDLGNGGFSTTFFQFLGIRLFTNTTTLDYHPSVAVGFYGGYNISLRRIQSILEAGGTVYEQNNTLNAGTFGFRWRPTGRLQVNLEGELGRANNPFYPISDKDYHGLTARVQYRTKRLRLAAAAMADYNFNTVSLANHSSHNRSYTADASWTFANWLSLDASFAKLHVDSLTGIQYFATGQLIADHAWYLSNIFSGTLGLHFTIRDRVSLFAGYSHIQDVGGDPRIPTVTPPLFDAQTFPLTFESPMARLSIRLHSRLRWNAGYQYYGYSEDLQSLQNYHANTGYTSLSWSF